MGARHSRPLTPELFAVKVRFLRLAMLTLNPGQGGEVTANRALQLNNYLIVELTELLSLIS